MFRYLLCVCLVLAGCAGTKQNKAYYDKPIRVSCEGKTFEQAKSICFSQAIEFSVGAVVVTETETNNKKLTKDEILKHSSGYVDDFKIENRIDDPDRVLLVMDVTVKNSVIAERILNAQRANGDVQGQRMGAQYTSFVNSKETGDKLLTEILNDYPKYAFTVTKGDVKYQTNIYREPVINIPVKIVWNYKYVEALKEALSITQDPKDKTIIQESVVIVSKNPKDWFLGSTETYHYNDVYRSRMIKEKLVGLIYINTAFRNGSGDLLFSTCDKGQYMLGPNITDPFIINTNKEFEGTTVITVRVNNHKIHDINSVEVFVTNKPCIFVD